MSPTGVYWSAAFVQTLSCAIALHWLSFGWAGEERQLGNTRLLLISCRRRCASELT
jgi:hypothetical protein